MISMTPLKNHKKHLMPLLVLLILTIAVLAFRNFSAHTAYLGVVEATIVTQRAEVPGKILSFPVSLGSQVKQGDLLVTIDPADQQYTLEQLEISLQRKKLALSDAKTSGKSQAANSVSIAQANLESAQSAYQKALSDYENSAKLYEDGVIPKDTLDQAKVRLDSAKSLVEVSKSQLSTSASQTPSTALELDVAQIQSQIQQAKEQLAKCTVNASSDGVIISKSYEEGDLVSMGHHLVDIASAAERYLVFYVPKEKIYALDYDQDVIFLQGKDQYTGIVKYIDVNSQYTPKDMQTTANKNKESVKVKLLLPEDCPLRPGEEAEVPAL